MSGRLVVVGAHGLLGRELVERMRAGGLGAELELVGTEEDYATLSSLDGELVAQVPDLAGALAEARAVVVCEPPSEDQADRLLAAAASLPVIDLTGVLEGRPIDAASGPLPGPGAWASPTASALLVARLATAAARAGGRGVSVALALEPASELGLQAVEEMHAQAVALLNFLPLPTELFAGQAVHDLRSPGREGASREGRLRRELAGLCEHPVSVLRVQSGAFHGVAVALRAEVDAGRWRAELAGSASWALAEDPAEASPVATVQSGRAVVGRVEDDGVGGAWAWAAADTLKHGAVGNAVRLLAAWTEKAGPA